MQIKSIVAGAAIALAVCLGAAGAAFAKERSLQYLGPSTDSFDGNSGYFAGSDACAATDFGFNVDDVIWCTSQMIIEGGPSENANPPSAAGDWVNPVIDPAFGGGALDFSGLFIAILVDLNCFRWTTDDAARRGLVFRDTDGLTGFPAVTSFLTQPCSTPRKAACCGKEKGRF